MVNKQDYMADGGLLGLAFLLVLSVLIRINIIQNEFLVELIYFPLKLGFYIYIGIIEFIQTNHSNLTEGLAIFLMFFCLVLFYHLAGTAIGNLVEKIKRGKKK